MPTGFNVPVCANILGSSVIKGFVQSETYFLKTDFVCKGRSKVDRPNSVLKKSLPFHSVFG
jgi:hypothetical protein